MRAKGVFQWDKHLYCKLRQGMPMVVTQFTLTVAEQIKHEGAAQT